MTPESILLQYDEKISTLGFQLREFLLSKLTGIIEEGDGSANIIGYSFGKGYKNLICTMIPSKKGIKLGFYKGSELRDPGKVLTGSGKVHKYAEIKTKQDISSPALSALLKEAVKAHQKRTS